MRFTARCVLICSLLIAMCVALYGQGATGNIIGRLTDSSGASIASAEATATDPEKGQSFRTVTDEQGMFRFFYLNPATYTLTFKHPGFGTVRTAEYRFAVESDTGSKRDDVGRKRGADNGDHRRYTVARDCDIDDRHRARGQRDEYPAHHAALHLDDDVPDAGRYQHERVPYRRPARPGPRLYDGRRRRNRNPAIGGVATNTIMSTTQNAIQEVKLASTVLPAEYGHSAGGMLSATYKSGTNALHFEGEDRYVNNDMLHRAYFNLGNAPFSYHELAGLLSGPVYLPKIYKEPE